MILNALLHATKKLTLLQQELLHSPEVDLPVDPCGDEAVVKAVVDPGKVGQIARRRVVELSADVVDVCDGRGRAVRRERGAIRLAQHPAPLIALDRLDPRPVRGDDDALLARAEVRGDGGWPGKGHARAVEVELFAVVACVRRDRIMFRVNDARPLGIIGWIRCFALENTTKRQ